MSGLPGPLATALYITAVLIGGYFFGREALEELVKERAIGIELLMLVATLVAGVMGQWVEAATLVFLYSISEAAEGYTAERARHAIRSLMDLAPKTALIRREGKEVRIPVETPPALAAAEVGIAYGCGGYRCRIRDR